MSGLRALLGSVVLFQTSLRERDKIGRTTLAGINAEESFTSRLSAHCEGSERSSWLWWMTSCWNVSGGTLVIQTDKVSGKYGGGGAYSNALSHTLIIKWSLSKIQTHNWLCAPPPPPRVKQRGRLENSGGRGKKESTPEDLSITERIEDCWLAQIKACEKD